MTISSRIPEVPEEAASASRHRVSVLVPVAERPGPLEALYRAYAAALEEGGYAPEFVFAVEPTFREVTKILERLETEGHPIRVLHLGQVVGESALLKLGAQAASAPVVLTLPPYWRLVPGELPEVVRPVFAGVADIAMARRWPRRDSCLNRVQNKVYHFFLRPLGGAPVHDVACGVRAMRREVLLELPLYGDFHRFLPLIAAREGYRVREVEAEQHPEDQRPRVYGPGVYLRRIIDIFGIHFLLRFTEKPLRFFGLVGSLVSFAGVAILVVLAVQRLQGQGIADRPMLLLGALLLVLGVQAIALGLVGEIIVHLSAPTRRPYRLLRGTASAADPPAPSTSQDGPTADTPTRAADGSPSRTRSRATGPRE
jgi:hypothetical protein